MSGEIRSQIVKGIKGSSRKRGSRGSEGRTHFQGVWPRNGRGPQDQSLWRWTDQGKVFRFGLVLGCERLEYACGHQRGNQLIGRLKIKGHETLRE